MSSSLVKVEMRLRRLRSDRQEAHLFAESGGSANQTYPFDSAMQRLSCCYKSKALEWLWPAPCEAEMLINLGVLKDIERLLVLEQKLSILQEIGNKALVWTILSAGFWCRPFFWAPLLKKVNVDTVETFSLEHESHGGKGPSYLQAPSKMLSHFSLKLGYCSLFILWHAMEEVVEGTTTVKAGCSLVPLDSFLWMWKETVYCLENESRRACFLSLFSPLPSRFELVSFFLS